MKIAILIWVVIYAWIAIVAWAAGSDFERGSGGAFVLSFIAPMTATLAALAYYDLSKE